MELVTLSNNIMLLFQETPPEKILHLFSDAGSTLTQKDDLTYRNISKKQYSNLSFAFYPSNSLNEREVLFEQCKQERDQSDFGSHFDLLAKFGEQTIELNGDIPLVKFDTLMEWRSVTHQLGQAIIVTAFLAKNSLLNRVEYTYWNWPTALRSNNRQLQNVLNNGMSENHYHLNGSTQVFPISWVCIMNNPLIIHNRINEIDANLYPRWTFGNADNSESWENLLKNAARIRLKLFEKLRGDQFNLFLSDQLISFSDIQKASKRMSHLYAYKTEQGKYLDYALVKDLECDNFGYNRILTGERKFLYDCFKASFSGYFTKRENNQFYYYLLVKNRFRCEIIQSNNMTGFANFSKYQSRKYFFFRGIDEYEREAVRLSLNDTLQCQSIRSLETRIMPEFFPYELIRSVDFYDRFYWEAQREGTTLYPLVTSFDKHMLPRASQGKYSENIGGFSDKAVLKRPIIPYFYVLHYPKGTTQVKESQEFVPQAKNSAQRCKNLCYSKSISCTLSKSDEMRSRVRGIDTCSHEIGCRPEVFATDFRYLKNYHAAKQNVPSTLSKKTFLYLGRTYHVGEDFLDLVDGMRAIDETIQFLGFTNGDRLGHALALGLNPKDHYSYKKNRVVLSGQDALDNFVWLYHRAGELNITIEPLLAQQLQQNIDALSREIYGQFCEKNNVELNRYNLYCAWKLRGDSPDLYRFGTFRKPEFVFDQYTKAKYVESKELNSYRSDQNISMLYYAYHFDGGVRKREEMPFEFQVDEKYTDLVSQVQKKLQLKIAQAGIMIECNPSSNALISTFRDYKKHPITVFNNLGLETDPAKIMDCPQISVSINTDDQGIFDTSLEYEYALMASALVRDTDEKGNYKYKPTQVYKYLNNIREMGNVQTFLRDFKK